MKIQNYSFSFLTPCLMSGADQQKAEIRVPSIRGEMRWWFRILGGDPNAEKKVFGGVRGVGGACASAVRLRITGATGLSHSQNLFDYLKREGNQAMQMPEAYFLWPLRTQKRGVLYPQSDELAGFDLQIHSLLPSSTPEFNLWKQTLIAFSYLGSLGTRSRRGYGSLWPVGKTVSTESLREKLQFLPEKIHIRLFESEHLDPCDAIKEAAIWMRSLRKGTNQYAPPESSEWGRNDHDAALGRNQTVYRPVLGLPLTQRFSNGRGTFQTRLPDRNDRWASPLRIKIARIGEKFRVMTIFCDDRAMPDGQQLTIAEKRGPNRQVHLNRELYEHMKGYGEVIH